MKTVIDASLDSAMFELAPVSLWLENYSALKALFADWRAQGVSDLRAYLRADADRVHACTAALKVVKVNRRTLEMLQARDLQHLLRNLGTVFGTDTSEQFIEEMVALWEGQTGFMSQSVNYSVTGKRLDIALRATVLPGHEQDWSAVLVAMEDVTERRSAERDLMESERYVRGLLEHSPVSLWVEDFSAVRVLLEELRGRGITDLRTFIHVHPEFVQRCMSEIRVLSVNRQTLQLFGAPDQATLLSRIREVFRDDTYEHFAEQLCELWQGQLSHGRETINYALDGKPVNVHMQFAVMPGYEQDWSLVLVSLTDITARKKAEAYLEYLGTHDVLTQVRNRAFFNDELARLDRKGPHPVVVVVMDLNGLKQANDDMGHAAGDALLRRAGEVLLKAAEGNTHVSRIGGDEFVVLMPGADETAGRLLVQRIRSLVEINNQFYGGTPLSFAVGMAVCEKGEAMLRAVNRADQLMYEDKRLHHDRRRRD